MKGEKKKISMGPDEGKTGRKCHWGSRFVFQWKGLKFFGAGSFRGMDTAGMDVIIDCGANVLQSMERANPGSDLPAAQPQIIKIGWPDGGVPDFSEQDWLRLLDVLQESSLSRKRDIDVLVCCVGGHGRTGTALSILAALTGVERENPVGFIRREYCPKAVESKPQCSYIRGIAKLDMEDDILPSEPDESCEADLRW